MAVNQEVDVLIIDDEDTFWKPLEHDLHEAGVLKTRVEESFESGLERLSKDRPATVVLDVYAGRPDEGNRAGLTIWDDVWKRHFVPIVFTSAGPAEDVREMAEKHPLLRFVNKNADHPRAEIVQHVKDLIPDGKDIVQIRTELDGETAVSTQRVLTRLVPIIWPDIKDRATRKNRLENAARRQLGNEMESRNFMNGLPILPWEQYILPPVGKNLLTSDILHRRDGCASDASTYRVVLTPSCDMVEREGGKTNVSEVLTGVCVPIEQFDRVKPFPSPEKPDFEERCRERLSPPQQGGLTALPAVGDIPNMAIWYKQLELIKLGDIDPVGGDTKRPYVRVLSVDSPFREQIVWAYLEIACRPGVPDRDWVTWGKAIVACRKPAASGGAA
jgi:CTP synthase